MMVKDKESMMNAVNLVEWEKYADDLIGVMYVGGRGREIFRRGKELFMGIKKGSNDQWTVVEVGNTRTGRNVEREFASEADAREWFDVLHKLFEKNDARVAPPKLTLIEGSKT